MRTAFPSGILSETALRAIPLRVEATKSWTPIRHADALDLVLAGLDRAGLVIKPDANGRRDAQFSIINDGHRVFGQFQLEDRINDRVGLMLGFANSTDRSTALKVGFGSHVFVCSNGCFFAEEVVGRRHTSRIMNDIDQKIDEAFASTSMYIAQQAEFFDGLAEISLTPAQVNDMTVRACRDFGVVTKGQILDVIGEYNNPQHDEFAGSNAWSYHNAVTEVLKKTERTNGMGHSNRTIALTNFLKGEFVEQLVATNN